MRSHKGRAIDLCRGVAKLVKALDFDSSMRRFESFFPCQTRFAAARPQASTHGALTVRFFSMRGLATAWLPQTLAALFGGLFRIAGTHACRFTTLIS